MTFFRITTFALAAVLVAAASVFGGSRASAAGPYIVYLPNITKTLGGVDGWHTPFIVQNVGAVATNLTVTYYRFADGALITTHKATVQPGRSFVDSPRDDPDLPDNSQFSVVVTSTDAPVVGLVNEHHGLDAGDEALSYSGASQGSMQTYLPLFYDGLDDWVTTLIIQNVSSESTVATAAFVSLDGKSKASITRTITPGRSAFIDPRVESSLVPGTIYAAMISAPDPIAVVSNHHHDLNGVTPAMGDSYNGVPQSSGTTAYVPYVAAHTNGNDPFSRIFVENAGNANAAPTFTFTRFGGVASPNEAPPFTGPVLSPGSGYQLVPPVPDGDWALTITGGTFVATVTTLTQSTAMFYTSTAAPQNKLFLPNVTRTLSFAPGDPGWNTPIYLQSATATNATLTWYRFSDGSLVTTQNLTLTPGMTTKIDPKTVSGLTDNSQYAVVIASTTGTFVAIVTEINPIQGDDAMVYKGFPAP